MPSNRFLKKIKSTAKPLILDGSLGTLLPQESQSHPLWSTYSVINEPVVISSIHQRYLDNGAQIIQTSTYQTSENTLKKYYPELQFKDVIKKSIDLAADAVKRHPGERRFIAGSVGPYGASLANGAEYTGDYPGMNEEVLEKFHKVRLETLCEDERVDLIAIETIPNLMELRALIRLMEGSNKPYYVSLSVNGETLADGSTTEQIEKVINEADDGLVAVGVNCLGLKDSISWLEKLDRTGRSLVVYPNSGEMWDKNKDDYVVNEDEMNWDDYLKTVLAKFKDTLKIIGGCCRTDETTIKMIYDRVAKEIN